MPFVYRLQKILNFRIQKKDEQLQIVKRAQQKVIKIQQEIDNQKQTLTTVQSNMRQAHHTMMETYDNYIKHLYTVIERLEIDKQEAIQKLEEEKSKLVELEKGVKVLEKHKEKVHETYKAEEKQLEMKRLDEVAGLKHYAKTQIRIEEEKEEDLILSQEEKELNEY